MLAEMRGAKSVDAIDIDNWCYLNSIENAGRNNCTRIDVYESDASMLAGRSYDVIIANINRNILLEDIGTYAKCLTDGGTLLLSGFYADDISAINEECQKYGLTMLKKRERNDWVSLKFVI